MADRQARTLGNPVHLAQWAGSGRSARELVVGVDREPEILDGSAAVV